MYKRCRHPLAYREYTKGHKNKNKKCKKDNRNKKKKTLTKTQPQQKTQSTLTLLHNKSPLAFAPSRTKK
jgi:hypothetical protein